MKRIWKREISLERINELSRNSIVAHLGIKFVAMTDDSITATMPVDARTHQPLGMLHGGASVVLAESVASLAANLAVPPDRYCVGLEINANHVRSVRSGMVSGTARPVHLGQSTHVWDVTIVNEENLLVCASRLTLAVLSGRVSSYNFVASATVTTGQDEANAASL
jgi:1,4-dihydroxy-2-naphthoyl-CoA hydrolase